LVVGITDLGKYSSLELTKCSLKGTHYHRKPPLDKGMREINQEQQGEKSPKCTVGSVSRWQGGRDTINANCFLKCRFQSQIHAYSPACDPSL
jgi:hypothetical protein